MENFDLEDSNNHYLNTLKTLNTEQLAIVSKFDEVKFRELLNKPQNEILQILIQTQITNLKNKGLEVLTDKEFDQYEELQKHLITVEKSETAIQQKTITAENQKQKQQQEVIASENQKQANLDKKSKENQQTIDEQLKIQNKKLDELRGILLSNPKTQDNPKIKILEKIFAVIDKNRDQKEMQQYLDKVISFLQEP